MANIHPTAIIHPKAKIAKSAKVGPYCVIDEHVELAENVILKSHVVVEGDTYVGEGTQIFQFASIGAEPHDRKYKGEKSKVIIGKNNKIREYVTIQPGTEGDKMITSIGNDCLLMVGAHVAHDCTLHNNVIMANYACLAGHVTVHDFVIIGGLSGIFQRTTLGAHSFVGGMTAIVSDLIPYGNATTDLGYLNGLNIIGMKRRNFSKDDIQTLRAAYNMIFMDDKDDFFSRVNEVEKEFKDNKIVMEVVDFLKSASLNSVCLPKNN
jgi:UDP-N-acetylglucosamine acyltransferase